MIGIDFTGIIYASPGVLKHINKRHGKQFNNKIYLYSYNLFIAKKIS